MAQPTPGPWSVEGATDVVSKVGRRWICKPYREHPPSADGGEFMVNAANATLISAAPDMLVALKGLVENPAFELGSPKVSGRSGSDKRDAAVSAWDSFVEAARTAIAKAEGR